MKPPPELPSFAELCDELESAMFAFVKADEDAKRATLARLTQFDHDLFTVDFRTGRDYDEPDREFADVDRADAFGSRIRSGQHRGEHTVAIDLDVPARLVPSSTPGHSHLYVDVPMTWDAYLAVLKALADAGVIETGYYAASERRGYTCLRLPWVQKERDE